MPSAARRIALLDAGLCTSCGVELADEGRTRCSACRALAAEQQSARRAAARERGLCARCMRAPATRGVRCDPCADEHVAAQIERDRRKRRIGRPGH